MGTAEDGTTVATEMLCACSHHYEEHVEGGRECCMDDQDDDRARCPCIAFEGDAAMTEDVMKPW